VTNTLKFARLVLTALCVCYGLLFSQVAFSQASSSPVLFSTTNIGSTSAAQAVSFTFSGSSTLASISVLTQGVGGLDFASAAGGNCTAGTSYTAGNTCTVNVTFTPTAAGNRYGAVVLTGTGDLEIATGYLQGTGAGPQINFLPGTEITVPTSTLNFPYGVAVDGVGDVYIVDSENNRVLKETLAGGSFTESTVSTSSLNNPMGIVVDGGGSIYIADSGNNRILKESPSGSTFTESTVPTSALSFPSGVAVDGSGDVYVADWGNNRVLMEKLSGGSYTESTVPTSSLNGPSAVAVDGSEDVYIVDSDNQRVLKETPSGGMYTESTVSTSALYYPGAISVDDNGNIYIADTGNNRILKESSSGTGYIESTISTSSLNFPAAVTVDGSGNVYIADTGNDRVLKEDLADPPSLSFAPTTPGATSSDSPQTVTLENAGSAALNFPVPSAGSDPSIAANFALSSSGGSACPLVSAGSSAGSLAAGQSCLLPISFTPTASGTFSGALAITDNVLNAPAPAYATQNIQLNGIGTGSTDQNITFDSISAQIANSTLALSATASSGLPVIFGSNSPSTCTVSGSVATLLTAGTCGIVASQPGNATYGAASPVTQSFAVSLASQTISFTAIPSQILNTSVAVSLSALASSGLPVSFTSTTSTVCTASGSTVTLLASGTCAIEASQSGNATFAAATPVTQSFTITSVTLPTTSSFGSVEIGTTSGAQSVTFTFAGAATLAGC
jgi:sugar lactone lactonase YvrE